MVSTTSGDRSGALGLMRHVPVRDEGVEDGLRYGAAADVRRADEEDLSRSVWPGCALGQPPLTVRASNLPSGWLCRPSSPSSPLFAPDYMQGNFVVSDDSGEPS
jgi:hypothetical protein